MKRLLEVFKICLRQKGGINGALVFALGVFCSCSFKPTPKYECKTNPIHLKKNLIYKDKFFENSDPENYEFVGFLYDSTNEKRYKYFTKNCNLKLDIGFSKSDSTKLDGKLTEYYPNQKIKYIGSFDDGLPIGNHNGYYDDGSKSYSFLVNEKNNIGNSEYFARNGEKVQYGESYKGHRIGLWKKKRKKYVFVNYWENIFYENEEFDSIPKYNSTSFLKEELGIVSCKETEKFIFYCNDKHKKVADFSDKILSENFDRVAKKYQANLDYKIKVYLLSKKAHLRKLGVNKEFRYSGICTSKDKIMAITYKHHTMGKGYYKKVLVHELSHAIVSNVLDANSEKSNKLPKWLIEGLAEYDSNDEGLSKKELKYFIKRNKKINSLKDLNRAFSNYKTMHLAYSLSYHLVRYLEKIYGTEKINQYIRNVDSFKEIFELNQDELWPDFINYVKKEELTFWEKMYSDRIHLTVEP